MRSQTVGEESSFEMSVLLGPQIDDHEAWVRDTHARCVNTNPLLELQVGDHGVRVRDTATTSAALLGATVEVVPECRSAPTPDLARRNIRAMGAVRQCGPTSESHHLCPCRSERQGVPQAPIQLARKQSPCTTMHNQQTHMKARAREKTRLCQDQNASVYSSPSSKIGFSLVLELHGWLAGRYGSATPIDSGGSTPRDARAGWCWWDA